MNDTGSRNGRCRNAETRGFTRIELSVTVVVVAVLVAVLWPWFFAGNPVPATPRRCIYNLKQIGVSFEFFAKDNDDKFPAQFPSPNEGAAAFPAVGEPAAHFYVVSNYLMTPKALACPADTRSRATNWEQFNNVHLSYFLSLTATPRMSNAILAGDRNLVVSRRPAGPGLLELTTNTPVSWSGAMHSQQCDAPCGYLLLADGSIKQVKARVMDGTWTGPRWGRGEVGETVIREDLWGAVRSQGLLTNRLSIP